MYIKGRTSTVHYCGMVLFSIASLFMSTAERQLACLGIAGLLCIAREVACLTEARYSKIAAGYKENEDE